MDIIKADEELRYILKKHITDNNEPLQEVSINMHTSESGFVDRVITTEKLLLHES